MRIVHLSTSDSAGGAARAAYRVHSGLLRLGHDSRMLVGKRGSFDSTVSTVKPSNDLRSKLHRFRRRRSMRRDMGRYQLIPGIDLFSDDRTDMGADIARAIRAMGPVDAITLHWVAGFLDYEGFFANYPPQVPLVWRLADMNALTGGCHYDGGCGRFTDRCGACPQLNSQREDDLSRQIWLRKKASLDRIGPGGMHLVATSQWIAEQAERSSLLGKFHVTVIPNGLNADDFAPRDRGFARDTLGIPRDANVVLFVADSVDNVRKGFKYVAEALKGVAASGLADDVVLLSLGVGRPEIGGGVKNVHLGTIKNDRLLSLVYSAADVYVIASLQESFGQTVSESLACGTPVVGFASGGIKDMVRPGITGYLAPTGDAAALRDAVLRAVRDDPATRRGMAENCRRIAVEVYSLEAQGGSYARLYETLVGKPASEVAHREIVPAVSV